MARNYSKNGVAGDVKYQRVYNYFNIGFNPSTSKVSTGKIQLPENTNLCSHRKATGPVGLRSR